VTSECVECSSLKQKLESYQNKKVEMQRTKKIKQQGMMINTLKNEKSEMDQRVEQLSAKVRI